MLVHFGVLELGAAKLPGLRTAFGRLMVAENLETVVGKPEGEKGREQEQEREERDPSSTRTGGWEEGPVLSKEEAYVLRAAAVDGCETIVQTARRLQLEGVGGKEGAFASVTLPELDGWLWSVAKQGRLRRSLRRFREVGTGCIMY